MSVAARHFIDGAYTSGSGNRNFENFNPVNSASLGFVLEGGAAEVDAAVAAAKAALSGPWGVMSVMERAELLHKVTDGITARFDEFLAAEVSDTGKPKSLAAHIDIPRGALRSVFANCGQVCLSTERIYVERPIFDEFTARLKAGAEALTPGAPEDPNTNLGPLISQEHRTKVTSYYARAKEEGAEIITGGGVPDMPDALAGGSWIEPTIWTGLGDQSAVIREKIFGPCCHIRPFDEEEEAVALANDTPYGLCCSLRTENLSRAHRV